MWVIYEWRSADGKVESDGLMVGGDQSYEVSCGGAGPRS